MNFSTLVTSCYKMSCKFVLIFFLTGCSREPLCLYTEYVGIEQYASFHVKTPDPWLACPEIGQRLVVKWDIPLCYWKYPSLHVAVTIRTFDGKEEKVDFPVCRQFETREWKIFNEDYNCSGGIATYKAELLSGEVPLLCRQHILWNETIVLDNSE